VVIRKGSVFVTAGTDRRSSGTHYTERSLTEPIVQYTLEPLVYIGPAEGTPKEEWKLRSAKELLDLKICDKACGSGAFLVQSCRYLSELLVEAWEYAEKRHAGVPGVTPDGVASTGEATEQLIPKDTNERLIYARRLIAQRCLYGVDKNPLAVEMAKLSLWLLTLAKDKPFTFLDHAIRCGDSLVGIRDIRQVQYFQLDLDHADRSFFAGPVMSLVDEAVALRKKIEALPANTVEDVREKERLFAEAEEKTARLRCAADLLISVEFQPISSAGQKEALHTSMAIQAGHYVKNGTLDEFRALAKKVMNGQPTFHWPLEFPEVMLDRGGFDVFVCNPPFMGGQKITGNLGEPYREYLVRQLARGQRGSADLCAYFFLRAAGLLREGGQLGFLATNTIAQGDTREVGLDQLAGGGFTIPRAVPSRPWPGEASLEVAHVWVRRGSWSTPFVLNDKPASGITSFLTEPGMVTGKPFRLKANEGRSFQGSIVPGMGFVLSPDEAQQLIDKDPRNKDVLFPYLNGEDLNSRPDQSPSRWVINFFDWPLDRDSAAEYYEGPVAADYPDCLTIVEEKVKPERMKNNRKVRRERWWQFAERAPELYRTIASVRQVLLKALTSKHHGFSAVSTGIIIDQTALVFVFDSFGAFALLQSDLHYDWSLKYGASLETRPRYSLSDCFESFPFPETFTMLNAIGQSYHAQRHKIMLHRREGLTKTYNRFHDPKESAADIQKLRDLQVQMDNAVAAAYGWGDLDLGHGVHGTKQGTRFAISESARREVLARLLKLNHERYADEVAQGLHHKKGGGRGAGSGEKKAAGLGRKSKRSSGGPSLNLRDADDPDPAGDSYGAPACVPDGASTRTAQADLRVQRSTVAEPAARPTPIDQIETDTVMAAFRRAARGRGWLERDELLREVSLVLGYQRLGAKIDETLRGHLRAAIRRRIIEADGPSLVHAGTGTMADYGVDELRETFRSVMRKGATCEREDVIHALARYLGFVRVTDTIRQPIKSAIYSAIRHGLLRHEGGVIWRD